MEAAGDVATMVTMRSMLLRGEERALAEVKGVDASYPLYGTASVNGVTLAEALADRGGVPGLVTERVLAERLALSPGDEVRLGGGTLCFAEF